MSGVSPFAPAQADLPLGDGDRPACHAVILARIGNYAALRRHLGRTRATLLSGDVADRLIALVPDARVAIVSRDTVEIEIVRAGAADVDAVSDRVRAGMATAFDLDGEQLPVEIALGVAAGNALDDDVLLVERAEQALATAIGSGSPANAPEPVGVEDDIGNELVRAIDAGEMVLFYQPKIHVRRQEITSAEALIRWQHPQRGLILPGDFIAAAEASGVIDRLTLWTIRQAIADQRTLAKAGKDLRLFVNISGQLLSDDVFVEAACRLVAEADASIGFEVTETSVIRNPRRAITNLQRFADIGIRIAIDDYGAGLSSLAYLKELPARELKIDKLFVTQLTSSNRDPLIVRSTIDLAHALEMEVVAEGVEDHAALALLTVMGCDMVQGFLISRPVMLDALVTFLSDGAHQQATRDSRTTMTRLASAWKRA